MRRPTVPPALADRPFTSEQAAIHGLTGDMLRSDAWRQLFYRVWVHAELEDCRELRYDAARLVLPPHAVACGLTAAWLCGVDVRRLDDLDVDVSFPKGKRVRPQPGLSIRQETLDATDIMEVDGLLVTTPLRTAFDCLRWLVGHQRLVVADALTHAGLVDVEELRAYFAGKRRLRNLRRGEALLDLVEPKCESPMETRLRLVLHDFGLPRPEPQWEVRDAADFLLGRLDFAYPNAKVGVEYDGAWHWKQRRADDRRRDAIRRLDWTVLVFSADEIFGSPAMTAAAVRNALQPAAA